MVGLPSMKHVARGLPGTLAWRTLGCSCCEGNLLQLPGTSDKVTGKLQPEVDDARGPIRGVPGVRGHQPRLAQDERVCDAEVEQPVEDGSAKQGAQPNGWLEVSRSVVFMTDPAYMYHRRDGCLVKQVPDSWSNLSVLQNTQEDRATKLTYIQEAHNQRGGSSTDPLYPKLNAKAAGGTGAWAVSYSLVLCFNFTIRGKRWATTAPTPNPTATATTGAAPSPENMPPTSVPDAAPNRRALFTGAPSRCTRRVNVSPTQCTPLKAVLRLCTHKEHSRQLGDDSAHNPTHSRTRSAHALLTCGLGPDPATTVRGSAGTASDA